MTDAPDLPPRIALAWGVAERPERAPKRELSIERIVETAIEIADADGLAAVSMAKVAQSLGFTTMSLYRYVTSKDDLLLLMQEAVLDVEYPPAHEPADWRTELREWAQFSMAVFASHPWFLDVPVTGAPVTPNTLRAADSCLRALRSTPLDEEEKMSVILLLSGYARNAARLEAELARAVDATGDEDAVLGGSFADALRELVDEVRFPYLRPLVESGAYAGEGQIDDTAWGLERLLDGLAVYVDARAAGAPGAGRDFRSSSTPPDDGADDEAPVGGAVPVEVSVHVKDPKVKKATLKRRDAERRVREAQKKVRELEKALREAEKAEREAARAAVEKARG
ncbi:TetR/AcrR family transcriptional regulator C-terminal domain-containing protein [Cellulosimicrobium cellulans]|uniref:TetR/AcrR family transcriptional regulator n=1 Tax=Cellulosimicrobium cellulans TaxID=1710 RepID=UPI00196625AB|nr:TetR/AcrR family transcriptional regulator [Cellulosimicrobium cellulans]MBN0042339.1 TetR/AcrR family transcriptional regulator C-terminal domain-containing protein [Cellulosimicrobium cellulans]